MHTIPLLGTLLYEVYQVERRSVFLSQRLYHAGA